MIGKQKQKGMVIEERGRLGKDDLEVKRGELEEKKRWEKIKVQGKYEYIDKKKEYGY